MRGLFVKRNKEAKAPRTFKRSGLMGQLIMAGVIYAALEIFGTPFLRVTYEYYPAGKEKVILGATYWTLFDSFSATSSELGRDTCPLIVLMHYKEPLYRRIWNYLMKIECNLNPEER